MSEAPGGPPPSRLEQARAMARAQAAARQERRAGRHAEIQTASKSTVSYLWLIQTYIVRALCLIYAVGTIMDIAGGRVPMVGGVIGIAVAVAIFVGETFFARVISGWIVRDTGHPPWRGAANTDAA
jgi:hypothetical protein